MRKNLSLLLLLPIVFSFYGCPAQQPTSTEAYTYKKGDPNGIGKWYMDREIAHVMGYRGMSWLDRPEREAEENTSTLLKNMNIQPEDEIADIGAGSGYHVFQMAPLANRGTIYAVDIQDEMLAAIKERKESVGIENVTLVKGSTQGVNLPANSVDKVLLVDVYHEFEFPAEMIASIKSALRPDGSLYLIEYRGEDPRVPIKKVHKMTEKQAALEMEAAGFRLKENIDNLPWQHCMIFVHK